MARRLPRGEVSSPSELEKVMDVAITGMAQKTYRCELVTPMYGGGIKAGEVDQEMPIRATEIRGHLRFWWRLLNKNKFGNDSGKLFEEERKIWGGLGDEKTLAASKVFIWVTKQPKFKPHSTKNETNPGIKYVLGQTEGELLPAKSTFELHVTCPSELNDEVHEVIRWWANFGGLGAKTRRGFGAILIKDMPELTGDETARFGCNLGYAETESDSLTAWHKAVEKLHKFRQGRGFARAYGREKPSRSFWPEPDQLRRDGNKDDGGRHRPEHQAGNVFARAAFGLPIIFDFRKTTEPPKTELLPAGDRDRMASPLIVRPCLHGGKWTATAILLPQWQDALRQPLRYKSGTGNPKNWPTDENEKKRIAELIPPMNKDGGLRGIDPLSAFMSFFGEHQSLNTKNISFVVKIEERWEKAQIKFETNGSVSAKQDNKVATAIGDDAKVIKDSLSANAKQKIAGGFYRACAVVKGVELLKVEEIK